MHLSSYLEYWEGVISRKDREVDWTLLFFNTISIRNVHRIWIISELDKFSIILIWELKRTICQIVTPKNTRKLSKHWASTSGKQIYCTCLLVKVWTSMTILFYIISRHISNLKNAQMIWSFFDTFNHFLTNVLLCTSKMLSNSNCIDKGAAIWIFQLPHKEESISAALSMKKTTNHKAQTIMPTFARTFSLNAYPQTSKYLFHTFIMYDNSLTQRTM